MPRNGTYLSVDLDYWGDGTNAKAQCTRFFNHLFGLGIPILVVRDHEQLLNDVNNSDCARIEHIDYHADLVENPRIVRRRLPQFKKAKFWPLTLNCGTWLNYVQWKNSGEVVWRYPHKHCFTVSNGRGNGSCYQMLDPFEDNKVCGWKYTAHGKGLRNIDWVNVAKIGVAISEEYWHDYGDTYETVLPKLIGEELGWDPDWSYKIRNRKRFDRFKHVVEV